MRIMASFPAAWVLPFAAPSQQDCNNILCDTTPRELISIALARLGTADQLRMLLRHCVHCCSPVVNFNQAMKCADVQSGHSATYL